MVTGIQQTYDQRARLVTQMQDITLSAAKEGRALTQDESDKWDKMEADERALTKTIEAHERTEKLVAERAGKAFEASATQAPTWTSDSTATRDAGKDKEYRDTFLTYLRKGMSGLAPEQRSMIEKRGTDTQVVGTDSLGGYGVPDLWQAGVIDSMKSYSGIFDAADISYTSDGRTTFFVTEDDTSTIALLVAEAGDTTVQDVTEGQKRLDSYMYRTLVKESIELMRDDAYNIEGRMQARFGRRFGRALNLSCTTGDGSAKPNGVVTASTLGKTAASATAVTFAEIIDLIHAVDPAYRGSNTFGLMFHDNVLAYLKKLSIGSSDARPLWQPSFRDGEADRIDGHRYWINQDMDSSINASSKLILAGDFKYYTIRMVNNGFTMMRLNELYAQNLLVGFLGFMAWDGELLNTSAVKHLITAAS